MMEIDFKTLLELHRDKFRHAVVVDRLLSALVVSNVLSAEEIQSVQQEHPSDRVDKLVDLLQGKGYETFKKFCVVLETTFPYMLNCMFLNVEPPRSSGGQKHGPKEDQTTRHMQCVGGTRRISVVRSASMSGHDLYKDRLSMKKHEIRRLSRNLDEMSNQLRKTEDERDMAYRKIAELQGEIGAELGSHSGADPDFEQLQEQCASAITELELLKHKNKELSDKNLKALQDVEYFRKQHRISLSKCDKLVREVQSFQNKFEDVEKDRDKLQQDYEEIVLLRERERNEFNEYQERTCGGLNLESERESSGILDQALEKCDTYHKECEALKQVHHELRGDYSHKVVVLQKLEEEYSKLKEQFDALLMERDNLLMQRNELNQQCNSTLKSYEKLLKERGDALRNSQQVQLQRDAALRDCDTLMTTQLKTAREIARLKSERDAAVQEHQLVMSERATVHREIEKLQEDLQRTQDDNKVTLREKDRLRAEIENLQREVQSILDERDKVIKDNYINLEQLNKALSERDEAFKERDSMRDEYEMFQQERDVAKRERSEAISHRDKILRECFEAKQRYDSVLKGETSEMGALGKQFEKLTKELANSLNDTEMAKSNRDWAFNERDKAVRERENLRVLSEQLRSERDHAVDKLKNMTVDAEHTKRLQNELIMELKTLRDKVYGELGKDQRKRDLLKERVASRDSAIDSDSNDMWETETVEIEKARSDVDLGFAIAGGKDNPLLPNDYSIIVTNVAKGSVADGKLRVNDCVLKVNNVDLTNVEHDTALKAIQDGEILNLLVKRKKSYIYPVHLALADGKEIGIRIDSLKQISWIVPGSVAAEDETLSVGDKIVSINGISLENLSQEEAEDLMTKSMITLTVQKLNGQRTDRIEKLEKLLDEVNDKIMESGNIGHFVDHRCSIDNTSSEDCPASLQTSATASPSSASGRNSPILEESENLVEVDICPPALSSSLTPLHEEEPEKCQETQHDSSEFSFSGEISASDQLLSKSHSPQLSYSLSPPGHDLLNKPPPPPRTFSFITAVNHSTTNSLPEVTGSDEPHVIHHPKAEHPPQRKHHSRPISAPPLRPTKVMYRAIDNNSYRHNVHQMPSSSSSDPFTLDPPPHHRSQHPTSPPAQSNIIRSRNGPYFTARSKRVGGPHIVTHTCVPVSGPLSRHIKTRPASASERLHSQTRHSSYVSQSQSHMYSMRDTPTICHSKQNSSDTTHSHQCQPYASQGSRSSLSSQSSPYSSSVSSVNSVPSTQSIPLSPTLSVGQNWNFGPLIPPQKEKEMAKQDGQKPRLVYIEKSVYPLGISIACGARGGIFVSSLAEDSKAGKAGLKYGDQLLEFNGINLRCASYDQAAKIMKQTLNSVTILAQYNPQKFLGHPDTGSSAQSSQASTATNTPVMKRKFQNGNDDVSTGTPRSEQVTPTNELEPAGDPRFVVFPKNSSNLGVEIIGGNEAGIFVSSIEDSSPSKSWLKVGDQILEFNGADMTRFTLEDATLELHKPTESVKMLVQYNTARYYQIRDKSGDAFYVRARFDRQTHEKGELSFKKGDILYVTDTMYKRHVGCWLAWLVNEDGAQKGEHGMIPSRRKAEQELLLRRSILQAHADEKLSGRLGLFRRSKKSNHSHLTNHSRESSDSRGEDAPSISTTCSVSELGIMTYQDVERHDSHLFRPVILLGPLVEPIYQKLVQDAPYKFYHCKPELGNFTEEIEHGIADGTYVDYVQKGSQFACTRLSTVKEVMEGSKHSLLEVSPAAVERLHTLQVYPIVVFIKFKSTKQIKELRDNKYIPKKISSKRAKELLENSIKLERECKPIFNVVVHGGNLNNICQHLQEALDEQQRKTLWVPLDCL